MKVIISCFGKLNMQGGGGYTAYEVSRYFYQQSALKYVLCMDCAGNITRELGNSIIKVIPKHSPKYISWRLLSKSEQVLYGTARHSRIYGEKSFDKASIKYLTNADILYCIKPVVPQTIRKAKSLGIQTMIQTATCHARFNKKIVDEEREKYGLPCIDTYCDESRVKLMEEVYDTVDWIITWHDSIAKTYIDYGIPIEKIRVLNTLMGFKKPVKTERDSKGKLEVLYAAHTNLLKGLHYLLGAWENYQLYKIGHLTICGTIDTNTRKIIKRENWKLQNVDFVGPVKTIPYYKKTDIVVLPSLSEGDSAVLREAMACGIPIIATENCGTKEIIKGFNAGMIVPVRDKKAIADAIITLHKNFKLRQHFGQNGRKVAGQFTWENYSSKLLKNFEKLLNKKRNG